MKQSKIKVDFFKLSFPDGTLMDFANLVSKIHEKPPEDRVEQLGGYHIWLSELSIENNLIEGELTRLLMDNIPLKGDIFANVEELGLTNEQGIVETMAFLYDTKTNIFLNQTSHNRIIPPRISTYVSQSLNLSDYLIFDPVLRKDAYLKLEKMEKITKFEFKVAGLDKFEFLGINTSALGDLIAATKNYKTPCVSVVLSTERLKTKTLSKDSILTTIRDLIGLSESVNVRKIVVDGKLDNDEHENLNFLKDRMREGINYKFTATQSRNFLYSERKEVLRIAWEKRKEDLEEMFSS